MAKKEVPNLSEKESHNHTITSRTSGLLIKKNNYTKIIDFDTDPQARSFMLIIFSLLMKSLKLYPENLLMKMSPF